MAQKINTKSKTTSNNKKSSISKKIESAKNTIKSAITGKSSKANTGTKTAAKKSATGKASGKPIALSKSSTSKTPARPAVSAKSTGPKNRKPVPGKQSKKAESPMMQRSRVELLQDAKKAGITGISRLNKQSLIKALSKKR